VIGKRKYQYYSIAVTITSSITMDQSTTDDNPFLRPTNSGNTIPSLFNSQSRATSVSSTSFPLFFATGRNYGNPVLHSPESSIKRGTRNIMSPLSSIKRTRTSVASGLQSARKVGVATINYHEQD